MKPATLLRLYPRAWRERYGEEFLAMVEGRHLSARDLADIVRLAAAEWWHTTWIGVTLIASASSLTAVTLGRLLSQALVCPPIVTRMSFVLLGLFFAADLYRMAIAGSRALVAFKMIVIGKPRAVQRVVWPERTVVMWTLCVFACGVVIEWNGAPAATLLHLVGLSVSSAGFSVFLVSLSIQTWGPGGALRASSAKERARQRLLRRWPPAKPASRPMGQMS